MSRSALSSWLPGIAGVALALSCSAATWAEPNAVTADPLPAWSAAAMPAAPMAARAAARPTSTRVVYDSFDAPGGYTLASYNAKWSNPYGPGEMGLGDTRTFDNDTFSIDAAPFRTGFDFGVFDHIKYLAVSNQAFPIPATGSVMFSIDIDAQTPGTIPRRVIEGTYVQSGKPYAKAVLQGQQAGATLHMIDFKTGQLFDWFVSGETAFTLVERLPAVVTGPPNTAGRDQMYTQIIKEFHIAPGKHTVAIRYSRDASNDQVEYLLDGKRVSLVENVGIPLDVQHQHYTGIYPSLGPGEPLKDQLGALVIGHGLFSLLDAFPFQHPDVPELNVSIPVGNRLFGQGARARFDNVVVTTVSE